MIVDCLKSSAAFQWQKLGFTPSQTFVSTFEIPLSSEASVLYAFDTGAPVTGGPVIDEDGSVLIGSSSGSFFKIKTDGSLGWEFKAEGSISAPAMLEGGWDGIDTVYFGDESGGFHALIVDTGEKKFDSFDAGAPITSAPFVRDRQ